MRGAFDVWQRGVRAYLAADPGLARLRSASGVTLTLVLALLVLIVGARLADQPLPVALLGAVVGTLIAGANREHTVRARAVTTVLAALPAMASVTLAATLNEWRYAADLGFVVVLFLATWARRFGVRGVVLGMAAFVAYFFSLFLHTTVSEVPRLLLSVLVGLALALLVLTVLLPNRPTTELHRLMAALRAACALAVEAAVQKQAPDAAHDARGAQRRERHLRRQLDHLSTSALLIESWLDTYGADLHATAGGQPLSLAVFDAQLSTEQLVDTLIRSGTTDTWMPEQLAAVDDVRVSLREGSSADQLDEARRHVHGLADQADTRTPAGLATYLAAHTVDAHLTVRDLALDRDPASGEQAPAPAESQGTTARRLPLPRRRGHHLRWHEPHLLPTTKAALQVAAAAVVATVVGDLVSPERWYWAVLTAFVVYNGTQSRGDILTRAWERVLGTFLGVLAGVVLGALVGRHTTVQLVLLVAFVFIAFYSLQISRTVQAFFLTMMLAMLYGLLGVFSVDVLALRLEETAVGAAIGVAAGYLILPTRTRDTVVRSIDHYLDTLSTVIRGSVEQALAPAGDVDLLGQGRDLDKALQGVSTSATPLTRWRTVRVNRGIRQWVRVLRACDSYSRVLARAAYALSSGVPSPAPSPVGDTTQPPRAGADAATTVGDRPAGALRAVSEEVDAHVSALQALLHGEPVQPVSPVRPALEDVLGDRVPAHGRDGSLETAVFALTRIDRAMLELLPRDPAE
ncbi:FUSC family protein [Rhodococcus sp. X156]|uniref:FUSC family protein n=1 Tax=Rhodococcus sp. X156 TaxID=2499145 RepID=UPI000FD7FEAD|nr:FUSC family protein [Rhodococcus sp. X156]